MLYYMFGENKKPNGLTQSSAERAALIFKNKKVSEVRLYGSPKSDYYPENMVAGKERTFALPKFNLINGRPEKVN